MWLKLERKNVSSEKSRKEQREKQKREGIVLIIT
jgi:hypothetical protein